MSLYTDLSGELALPARWCKCAICGWATPQPPVCGDLRCEDAYNLEVER